MMVIGSHRRPLSDERRWLPPRWAFYGGVFVVLVILWNVMFPDLGPVRKSPESSALQTSRTLALCLFQYVQDNGSYPDGKSSTEVFQKLIDGNYITDPTILYVPMPGKTAGRVGSRLRRENVCYDVTSGIQMNSSDNLPVVFLTGFRVDYRPGGGAVSLARPFPSIPARWPHSATDAVALKPISGLPVAYKSNNAYFRVGEIGADGMGVVRNALPPDFNTNGPTYRQLTPEGPLK